VGPSRERTPGKRLIQGVVGRRRGSGKSWPFKRVPCAAPREGVCFRKVSVLWVPNQGVNVRIGLPRGPAEIGVDGPRAELGRGNRERDVLLARGLARGVPAGADLDVTSQPAVVGLVRRRALVGYRDNRDLGSHGERLELTFVATVLSLRNGSDGSHAIAACVAGRGLFPGRHARGRGGLRNVDQAGQ